MLDRVVWLGPASKVVAPALAKRGGVAVKALVRPNTDSSRTEKLRNAGVMITPIDLCAVPALSKELTGAIYAASTLQGLRDVIHTAQGKLLEASVAAKVPRFIPSDFSLISPKLKSDPTATWIYDASSTPS